MPPAAPPMTDVAHAELLAALARMEALTDRVLAAQAAERQTTR